MILAFLRNNQARIVDMLYERIHQTTQAEAHFVPNELHDNIVRGAAAFLTTLEANDSTAIDHFITDLIAPRTVEILCLSAGTLSGPLLVSFFSIHFPSITMEEKAHDHCSDPA
jgi:hypothetical protein